MVGCYHRPLSERITLKQRQSTIVTIHEEDDVYESID
jgi:hypothetical protein